MNRKHLTLLFISLLLSINSYGISDLHRFYEMNLESLLEMYSLREFDLKGDVHIMKTYNVKFSNSYGEIHEGETRMNSYVEFDKNGKIKKDGNDKEITAYYHVSDTVIFIEKKDNYYSKKLRYKYDEQGRVNYITDGKQVIKVQYTPTGYKGEFWEDTKTKADIKKENNIFSYKYELLSGEYYLDKKGRPVKYRFRNKLFGRTDTEVLFKYNDMGDMIFTSSREANESKPYTQSSWRYEYVIDEHGNWTERKQFNKNDLINWEKREFEYRTPDEIDVYEKERVKELEKRVNNIGSHLLDSITEYSKRIVSVSYKKGTPEPIKCVKTNNDMYDFAMSNGSFLNNIVFTVKKGDMICDSTNTYILEPDYNDYDGPSWYLHILIDPNMTPIDWLKEYERCYNEYFNWKWYDKVSDSMIIKAFERCIPSLKFNVVTYKIEDPYEGEFKSPSISNIDKEKESLIRAEKNRHFDELCKKIFSQPSESSYKNIKKGNELLKIKKFKNRNDVYEFKLSDGQDVKDITFVRLEPVPGSKAWNEHYDFWQVDNSILISSDEKYAIILPRVLSQYSSAELKDLTTGLTNEIDWKTLNINFTYKIKVL